jgi:hypothetical protein
MYQISKLHLIFLCTYELRVCLAGLLPWLRELFLAEPWQRVFRNGSSRGVSREPRLWSTLRPVRVGEGELQKTAPPQLPRLHPRPLPDPPPVRSIGSRRLQGRRKVVGGCRGAGGSRSWRLRDGD